MKRILNGVLPIAATPGYPWTYVTPKIEASLNAADLAIFQ